MSYRDDAKRRAALLRAQSEDARRQSYELVMRSRVAIASAGALEEQIAVTIGELAGQQPARAGQLLELGAAARTGAAHARKMTARPPGGEFRDDGGGPPDRRPGTIGLTATPGKADRLTAAAERDRIAAELSNSVIQRVFAAGLSLHGAAGLTSNPQVRERIEEAVQALDQAIREIRQVVFRDQVPQPGGGLSQDVLKLSGELATAASISFNGLADSAVLAVDRSRLLLTLQLVLGLIGEYATPESIDITAVSGCYRLTVDAASLSPGTPASGAASWLAGIEERVARSGTTIAVEPVSGGIRLTCHVPKIPPQRLTS